DREILNTNTVQENSTIFTNVAQDQTIQVDNSSIGSGIIDLVRVWNKTGGTFELLNSTYYNYSISTQNGIDALRLTYTGITTTDLKIEYSYIPIITLTHFPLESMLSNSTIKILLDDHYINSQLDFNIDYNITGDNLEKLIFYTFRTSLYPEYGLNDVFFIGYYGYFTEEVNIMRNMILEFLDYDGKWKPIAKVPVSDLGDFDFKFYIGENGLAFPIGEETIMRLSYLPINLTNYADQDVAVNYDTFNATYVTNEPIYELFTLFVEGKESTIKYIPTDISNSVDQWATIPARKYTTTTNIYETLQDEKPYTILDFYKTITDSYEFKFQLVDDTGNALQDQLIWMEIGWKPKAGLNYKIIDWEDENGDYIDSEALGTAWFMDQGQEVSMGPGVEGVRSRMFNRPEEW
ncbi:hypothetical protein LCGC14_2815700, partial [marine sediment metagenome]